MKKPIIGITLDLNNNTETYKYSSFPWYALRQNYAECIIAAGGMPIFLPFQSDNIDQIINTIDGLLVPGSDNDVHPKFYNHQLTKAKVHSEEKTVFELSLIKKIIALNKPYLGICNGMQTLNVALGGTLIQHIPDYIKSDINHEQTLPKNIPTHPVNIHHNTHLANIIGAEKIMVNSTHHQAIGDLGADLVVSAIAPDGIIEGIELPLAKSKFTVAVEWHPEYVNGTDINLFRAFVDACNS